MIYLFGNLVEEKCIIGYAENVVEAMDNLQTESPFELHLMGLLDGDNDGQILLQAKFKQFKIANNWFKLHNAITDYFSNSPYHQVIPQPVLAVKQYLKGGIRLMKMEGNDIKVFFFLAQHVNPKNQTIHVDKNLKEEYSQLSGRPASSFGNALTHLVKAGLILRVEVGVYKLIRSIAYRKVFAPSRAETRALLKSIAAVNRRVKRK